MSTLLKRIAGITVFALMVAGTACGANPVSAPDRLDKYMRERMDKAGVPGAQVAVIRKHRIVALRSYGLANIKENARVDDTTAFSIASITKALIGVAAMQLVEQGKLDLSAPISRYLDDLPAAWREITVRQLLTHVSGLPDLWKDYNVIAQDESEAMARVKAMPMVFQPGARFEYNQTNYVLIGRILSELSGVPYTELVKTHQLNAVGMTRTAFADSGDNPTHSAGRYTYYRINGGQRRLTKELEDRREDQPSWFAACNGLMSTAEDLAKWIIALQGHDLLKAPGSLAALWEPGQLKDGRQSPGFGYFLNGYALGWETASRPEHRAVAATGGERSALLIYPDDDLAIVVLTNLMSSEPEGWIDGIAALYFSGQMGPETTR